jgi:hypothetical protein
MRKSTVAATLVASIALAGCGKSSTGPRLTENQLRKLVLQQRDVSGLDRFSFGREVTSEFNPLLGRDPHAFRRQNGWVVRYRRRGNAGPGALTVASVADVFSSGKDAQKFLDAVQKSETETAEANGLKEVTIDRLGEDAVAVATARTTPAGIRFVRISWRDGRFVCSVSASGFARRMSVDDIVAHARKQERRLG